MSSFVDVFSRIPYLLGNGHVSGFLFAKVQFVEEEGRHHYGQGLKDVVFMTSTCKGLYAGREYISYYRRWPSAGIPGFRNLDCFVQESVLDGYARQTPARVLHFIAYRLNRRMPKAPLSLASFTSLKKIILYRPNEGMRLTDVFDVSTWTAQVSELEVYLEYAYQSPAFNAVLPVRRLTFSIGYMVLLDEYSIDIDGLSSWPVLEEIRIESMFFHLLLDIVGAFVCLPCLRTLQIETGYSMRERIHTVDLRASPHLQKVVVHILYKGEIGGPRINHPLGLPQLAEEMYIKMLLPVGFSGWERTLDLPFEFRKWDKDRAVQNNCWKCVKLAS